MMAYRGSSRAPTDRFAVIKHANLVRGVKAQRMIHWVYYKSA